MEQELIEAISKYPDRWNLCLRIDHASVAYTLYAPKEELSFCCGIIGLDSAAGSELKSIENALYDSGFLVNDFRSVSIVVDTESMAVMPDALTDEQMMSAFDESFPSFDGDVVVSRRSRPAGVAVVFGIAKGLEAFLMRTYYNARIISPLCSLIPFFGKRSRLGNVSKLNVSMSGNRLYVMVFGGTSLLFANAFTATSADTAAYFVLSAWQQCGCNPLNDEITVSGISPLKSDMMDALRQYVSFVMPALFPSQLLTLSKDTINIPFELTLLSLCE